ncbi:MAG: MopE-related protein, partial [Patescibacteria group bacterium]
GLCVEGSQLCDATGHWGDCLGETNPDTEVCDLLMADEDCDGTANETCSCVEDDIQPCGPESVTGVCRPGVQTCTGGTWGACVGPVYPATAETCANLTDDDCNGVVDDGCGGCIPGSTISCGTSVGLCVEGSQLCDATGHWGDCLGETNPDTEVCDLLMADEDCDGTVDEGLLNSCGTCGPVPAEICGNGIDDNCNGFIDDGCGSVPCTPGPEVCGNGTDDDCDTVIDDGCAGPGLFTHCWTLPGTAPRASFWGWVGWHITTGPGHGIDGTLDIPSGWTGWQLLVEGTSVPSLCMSVALDPGMYIEYNADSDLLPSYWNCINYPGVVNGSYIATLGGASVTPSMVDNLHGGCNFRYQRP